MLIGSSLHLLPDPKDGAVSRQDSPFDACRAFLKACSLFLFPPQCRCCQTPLDNDDGIRICQPCWQKVELIRGDVCTRCGYPLSDVNPQRGGYCGHCPTRPVHFDSAHAAAAYDGALRSLIHALKFRFHEHLASFLALFLADLVDGRYHREVDLLVPVPLHWLRRRWREFNQSLLLAKALSERSGIPVGEHLLRRVRRTRPQSRTSGRAAKRRNVRGAFRATDAKALRGTRVLLVDDIYTSGSTVNECARVLKVAGVRELHVVTVARLIEGGKDSVNSSPTERDHQI
jgi:ComF family protein